MSFLTEMTVAVSQIILKFDIKYDVCFQERLVAIIFGMFRQHKYNFVDVYREEACTGLKAIIKQVERLTLSPIKLKQDEI